MKTLTITKPSSALHENPPPSTLLPMDFKGGILQTMRIEGLNSYGLFYQARGSEGAQLLATHDNAFSCYALADRMIHGSTAMDQFDFILECGGAGISRKRMEAIVGLTPAADSAAPGLLDAAILALKVAEASIHDHFDGTSILLPALAELEPVRRAIAEAGNK